MVVVNLLTKALKATPAGGHVTVTVDASSDTARLVVADTGGGIASEELPPVFERFWRGPNAEDATGSGIGLAIVDELVTAHHGRVEAQSALGQGGGLHRPASVGSPTDPARGRTQVTAIGCMVQPVGVDTKSLVLQEQLVALVRACGLHNPDRTPCGQPVPISEAHALMEIGRGDPISQVELASRLRLDKSTVSRLVRTLEQRGWISRHRSIDDGRVDELSLTSDGADAHNDLGQARARRFATVFNHIPEHERPGVFHSIDILVEALRVTD
jgi:DNA-binding MarR family transcriptional regulator